MAQHDILIHPTHYFMQFLHSSKPSTYYIDTWIAGDNNILELFEKYKAHCLQEKIDYKSLDSHLKELL